MPKCHIIILCPCTPAPFPFPFNFCGGGGWGEEPHKNAKETARDAGDRGERNTPERSGGVWSEPRAHPRRIGSRWQEIGAYTSVPSHHALRACEVNRFAIGNGFAQRLECQ